MLLSTLMDDSGYKADVPEVSHETLRSGKDLENLLGVSCYDSDEIRSIV